MILSLIENIEIKKKILGICLGMQLCVKKAMKMGKIKD